MFGQLGNGDTNNIGDESNEMGDNLREIDLGTGFTPMQVMLGGYHTCALSTTKKAKCWGSNTKGELGYGHTNHTGDQPNEMGDNLLEIDLGSNFTPMEIVGGWVHVCALSTTNTIKCFGSNGGGQLGYGDTNNRGDGANEMGDSLLEIDLGSNFTAMQIIGGWRYTCALSTENKVKCWGYNQYGLGYEDSEARGDGPNEMGDNLPEIDLGPGFMTMQIAAGNRHTCALSTANEVKCWGFATNGELGTGYSHKGDNPGEMGVNLPVTNLGSNFTPMQIAVGYAHNCALSTTRTVKCWGNNNWQELGTSDTTDRGKYVSQMGNNLLELDLGAYNFVPIQVFAGDDNSCALSTNGTVKCWGSNFYGQSGSGTTENTFNKMGTSLHVTELGSNFITKQISPGRQFTCVVSTTNKVKCFGDNDYGTLGYGDKTDRGRSRYDMGDSLPEVDLGYFGTTPPTAAPSTAAPTSNPITANPSSGPTTAAPTSNPTTITREPSVVPTTGDPTSSPSRYPTTGNPTSTPSRNPTTGDPTSSPSREPTTGD
eukprot:115829_1